ncbi:glutamate--tRNA ligase family protein, partial [Candidatus Phytoplasma asteris]|uniref:glutamate--tRNA ligase family protein n=1 Tax=Candidatus Phytoplasma asteris TaxID=85620 RepID=UPI0039DFE35B
GWDDPRMPTLSGIRKKGYTPEAIKNFVLETGLSKVNSQVKQEMLESLKLYKSLSLAFCEESR